MFVTVSLLLAAACLLPAAGKLSVRLVLLTTRMGRTVRYLSPAFTSA